MMIEALTPTKEFEKAYSEYLAKHQKLSKGNRFKRLQSGNGNGHGHAEKAFLQHVWWPVFFHFDDLAPEYEVKDFKDGARYLDYSYICGNLKLAIEVDGFGPHWRDISKWQFADNLMRQNHLMLDGWKILRFAYDDIMEKPRRCQQMVQQFFGHWSIKHMIEQFRELTSLEREILNLASGKSEIINASSIARQLGISNRRVRPSLKKLMDKQLLIPLREDCERIRSYRLNPKYKSNIDQFSR